MKYDEMEFLKKGGFHLSLKSSIYCQALRMVYYLEQPQVPNVLWIRIDDLMLTFY